LAIADNEPQKANAVVLGLADFSVVIPLALFYGGFWIWYAPLLLIAHSGLVDISKAVQRSASH